ncbi:MAG: hypothetical protein ACLP6G_16830 [Terriglobales bacterium]
MKSVIMLATIHEYQVLGNPGNPELTTRVNYLKAKLGANVVLEEWSEKQGHSAAEEFAPTLGLRWVSVGTPYEPQFRTYSGKLNYPGYNGTLRWDPHAPPMDEYGPFENQEARENRMAENVQAEMQDCEAGLFILGIAHMHSLFAKLLSRGFKVTGFSWLGPS